MDRGDVADEVSRLMILYSRYVRENVGLSREEVLRKVDPSYRAAALMRMREIDQQVSAESARTLSTSR